LERLARDEHYSLLRKFVNYARKKFIGLAPDCLLLVDESTGHDVHFLLLQVIGLPVDKVGIICLGRGTNPQAVFLLVCDPSMNEL
jgi:hypothetical protein